MQSMAPPENFLKNGHSEIDSGTFSDYNCNRMLCIAIIIFYLIKQTILILVNKIIKLSPSCKTKKHVANVKNYYACS